MIWFFIVASFTLHLLAIFAFVILYQRISFYQTSVASMREELEATYESIEFFIEDIEKGNQALVDKVMQANSGDINSKQDQKKHDSYQKLNGKINPIESKVTVKKGNQQIQKPVGENGSNNIMLSKKEKYKKVEQLAIEGYSEEYIAKQLKCGKGEIKLIFHMLKKKSEVEE
jgi:hypothetical protein